MIKELKINKSVIKYTMDSTTGECCCDSVESMMLDAGLDAAITIHEVVFAKDESRAQVMQEFADRFKDYAVFYIAGDLEKRDISKRLKEQMIAIVLDYKCMDDMYPEDNVSIYLIQNKAGKAAYNTLEVKYIAILLREILCDKESTGLLVKELQDNSMDKSCVASMVETLQSARDLRRVDSFK